MTSPVKPLMEPGGVRHVFGGGRSQLDQVGVNQPVEVFRGVGVGISGRKEHVPRKEVENGARSGSTAGVIGRERRAYAPQTLVPEPSRHTIHHSPRVETT